jgi:NAD+ synthase (glutamine-hydrolysing)
MDSSLSLPIVNVSTCSLNQLGMDFKNNYERIKKSILIAKELGAKLRVGPELEICGYDCFDHFLELDTLKLCWEVLAKILNSDLTDNIICEFGMPVLFKSSRYNCRIFCLNRKILLIRPKIVLAENGIFNENRYFVGWGYDNISTIENYILEPEINKITLQKSVPFGVAIIQTDNASIASEICVESISPFKISNLYILEGVDIITNGCGWVCFPNILKDSLDSILGAIKVNYGIYIFSNFNGSCGGNYIYGGNSFINASGKFLNSTKYIGFNEVEVINAKINLDDIKTKRANFPARNVQQNENISNIKRIYVKFNMLEKNETETLPIELPLPLYTIDIRNQNILSVSRYLWDYLKRRQINNGYLLEITEDIYSVIICVCLKTMCRELMNLIKTNTNEKEIILTHLKNITSNLNFNPVNEEEIANSIIFTINYGKISEFTNKLVKYLNSKHMIFNLETNINMTPNKISRLKMLNNYEYAESFKDKSLLVISKLNTDVGHFGEYTKFGELYGDITPLAGHTDTDIKKSIECSLIGSEICDLLNKENVYDKLDENLNKDLFSNLYFIKKAGLLSLTSNLKNKTEFIKKYYNKLTNNLSKIITVPNQFHSTYLSGRYNFRPIYGIKYEDTLISEYINSSNQSKMK